MVEPGPSRQEVLAELTGPGQPFELVEVLTRRGPHRRFVHAPDTLWDVVSGASSDAEYYVFGDERWTFADTHRRAAALARALVDDHGVVRGDRVAISMRNYPEWIVGMAACAAVGAVAVAVNSMWSAEEFHFGLRDSGATVLLADGERVAQLAGWSGSLPSVLAVHVDDSQLERAGREVGDLRSVLDAGPADATPPAVEVGPDDPVTIFYTSGSTGLPKGVLSSHRQLVHALLSWELDTLLAARLAAAARPDVEQRPPTPRRQTTSLLAVPLFHVTGCHAVALLSFRAQRRVVAMPRWDAAEAARLIEAERVDSFVATPAMVADLLEEAATSGRDLSSLRLVGGGGAPRPPEQVRRIGSSFDRAAPNNGWGMTETNAIGAGNSGEDYLRKPASSGRCSQVLQLKVVDESGRSLPTGQRGELLIRGTSIFNGYWKRPEANAQAFTDGDWFRTGDVAYIDDEGFLFIVDRIKDLIIRGGENIGCGHVEAALLMHPLVREAAVYGVPDERLGEEVGATIYASEALDLDELRQFLAAHLARFELPRHLRCAAQPLPRTPSGKILKRQIRQDALAEIGRGTA